MRSSEGAPSRGQKIEQATNGQSGQPLRGLPPPVPTSAMKKKVIALLTGENPAGLGLARAIMEDAGREFAARAMVRSLDVPGAALLRTLGAEVTTGDLNDEGHIQRLLAGAHGAFYIHLS